MSTKEKNIRTLSKENTATAKHYETLQKILGKQYIRSKIESPYDFITLASKGINANVIVNFRKHFSIPREFAADLLNVSAPTIYRWVQQNKKLDRNYSVQLFELTDLFLFGIKVFESKENFFQWLGLPNTSLGGHAPKEILEIPGGVAKVKDLIGRIEYGVYS